MNKIVSAVKLVLFHFLGIRGGDAIAADIHASAGIPLLSERMMQWIMQSDAGLARSAVNIETV